MADSLLLYNPAAGRSSVSPFIGSVIRALQASGWRVEVAETLNGRHTTQLARQAAAEKYRAVFAIGGDGTIGQVASGLMGSQTALGVLPAGTANVWAMELGLRAFTWFSWRALRDNARLLADAPIYAVDVGLCNGLPFLMWAGIGLDALTVRKLEPRRRFEKYLAVPQYAATTIWNASLWHGMNLSVLADDKRVEGHYLLAVATNIRHYVGGLAEISPGAYLNDGLMDLWLLSGDNLADAFRHFFDMRAGRLVDSNNARCITFRRARIESETPFSLQMDGEPMLGAQSVQIEVIPEGLRALVPPGALHLMRPGIVP
ncbi:MAG: diacylglycerol kinase family lipid kinase [Chloroflexi bacterium]|nr:diacylglycerol kinase family lipid kinase [Chloroflexota bacterium]